MSLRFAWDWESAPEVRIAELAATWSRLTIEVDDVIATLVEEREHSHGVRKSIDVPTYPLAEWLAINWWVLNAIAHRPGQGDVRFTKAGSGFPWPDVTLRSDRNLIWVQVKQRNKEPDFVRFLTQGQTVLDAEQCIGEIARFIDATVRCLEERGISDTFLQQEWSTVQSADVDERAFCSVAAAWGFDPYDMPESTTDRLLAVAQIVEDSTLLAELAHATTFESIESAGEWMVTASQFALLGEATIPVIGSLVPSGSQVTPPWREGYRLASQLRQRLQFSLTERVPIEEFVRVSTVPANPPPNVDALVKVASDATGIVMGGQTNEAGRRFAGARALARKATGAAIGLSLLTRGTQYSDRAERAFAAEFLAPAAGLRDLIGEDYSEQAQRLAAKRLGVSLSLIEHQIENQLAA
ncbi:MAG TPA: hypothetical protein VIU11_14660 [Nakamurella sp.]